MSNIYDCAIIGTGVAGAFAALKLSQNSKNFKVIAFDIGRPPAKRRTQMFGFLGSLPSSDGKLYLNNIDKVSNVVGSRRTKSAHKWVNKVLLNIENFVTIKDRMPTAATIKKLNKLDYSVSKNDYIQICPKDVHMLSKYMVLEFEKNKDITFCFDSEVTDICKQKSVFVINAEGQEYKAKKVIFAVGRSGWRWAAELYKKLGKVDLSKDYFQIVFKRSGKLFYSQTI